MKKIIFTVLAAAAFSTVASAQTPDVKIGAKAGVNFSNFSKIDNMDTKMKTSFHLGAVAEIFINEKFSVQPEVLYSSQGSKIESNFLGVKFNGDSQLDYIQIPIMAKYYIAEGFNVQAGPQVGFLVKAESSLGTNLLSGTGTTDIKDQMNSVDFGINLGLGYELPMGVFFDARYNLGLTKLEKDRQVAGVAVAKDYKNRVIQVSVGYKF